VRVVLLRTGMVLEQDDGALLKMLLPFRLFAGGPIMPGTQWVSWIHRHDHIGLIQWILMRPSVSGPVNAVAPEAVTMNQSTRSDASSTGRAGYLCQASCCTWRWVNWGHS
jgi:NAD dependent epimerase/dehydratase family enzyme